jgi:hypothetical protein
MHRSTALRCLALTAALGLAACAAFQAQHARPAETAGAGTLAPSEEPGREFKELATSTQLVRVRGEVEETRWNLGSEGKYSCCVEPPCSECLLKHGECNCRAEVRNKRPSCGECTQGWVEGRGVVAGVSALELLERKKQQVREKETGGEGQEGGGQGHHHH